MRARNAEVSIPYNEWPGRPSGLEWNPRGVELSRKRGAHPAHSEVRLEQPLRALAGRCWLVRTRWGFMDLPSLAHTWHQDCGLAAVGALPAHFSGEPTFYALRPKQRPKILSHLLNKAQTSSTIVPVPAEPLSRCWQDYCPVQKAHSQLFAFSISYPPKSRHPPSLPSERHLVTAGDRVPALYVGA